MAPQRPPEDNPRRPPTPGDPRGSGYAAGKDHTPANRPASNPNRPGRPYQPLPSQPANPNRPGPRGTPPPRPGEFFTPSGPPAGTDQPRRPRTEWKPLPATPGPRPPEPGRRPPPRRRPGLLKPVLAYMLLGGLVVLILTGLFVATRLFGFLNNISVERQDTSGNVIQGSSITGKGRVNIVLLGLDRRPNDGEGTRSDSMLLVSVDQDNKSANLLSIPRDLWIQVPGHGNNRINTAYFFGDQARPGKGGPPLVKEAIQQNFGIRVDYFVEVDFNGFRAIVDAIGGVIIDVKKPLVDNEYPTEDYGIKRIYIQAGVQRMNGQVALEYARSRHADSDLGRNQRQQEVLLAVREQGINLGLLTNTQLQAALQGTVKTDLTPGDIFGLGQIAAGMKREAIRQFSIDANITRNVNINGNDVLQADPAALKQLLSAFQTTAPVAVTPAREAARVNVLNGTFIEGRAARTQKFLESKGFTVAGASQATDAGNYPRTIINVYNGKQNAAAELAGLLGVTPERIKPRPAGPPGVDIEVICGEDLRLPE